jgi:hypothetical protein
LDHFKEILVVRVGGRMPLGAEDMVEKDEKEGYTNWHLWILVSIEGFLIGVTINDPMSFYPTLLVLSIIDFFLIIFWLKYKSISPEFHEKLHYATRRKFHRFLMEHTEMPFSEKQIVKKIENSVKHPYYKAYIRKYGKSILRELLSNNDLKKLPVKKKTFSSRMI